ncbi:MAG: HD-GYP domain-containing protein (c-di-GMP phosphodiesterase class II) [Candidatus Poriferisodalaceae bacterium]|jgi:HD-GYP domain-containing protein (c-di-GMP phosphodiesterase class II)
MAANGPTQSAQADDNRWEQRAVLARILRAAIAVIPGSLALVFGMAMRMVAGPERLGVNKWLWLVVVLAGSTGAVIGAERALRRLTPLTVLLKMSLIFPDEAPSRFKMALRSGTTRSLQRRIDEVRSTGEALDDESAYAEQMLELVAMLSQHDRLTRGHCERVRAYTDLLITEMEIPEADANKLRWAALLHDVGKLMVPFEILNKEGRPTEDEWEILKSHTWHGQRLVIPLKDWLGTWARAVGEHHERWDGGGYPLGLKGDDIHLGGRIVAVADAYDVMTSARSYKKPLPAHVARKEIADCAGGQFDPEVARAFLNLGLRKVRWSSGFAAWLSSYPALQGGSLASLVSTVTSTGTSVLGASVVAAGAVALPTFPIAFGPDVPATESAQVEQAGRGVASPGDPVVIAEEPTPDGLGFSVDDPEPVPLPLTGRAPNTTAPAFEDAEPLSPVTSAPATSTTRPPSTAAPATTTPATSPAPTTTTPPPVAPVIGTVELVVTEDQPAVGMIVASGDAMVAGLSVLPVHGIATLGSGAEALASATETRWDIHYTPTANFAGTDNLQVEVCTGDLCATRNLSFQVFGVADTPVAPDTAGSTLEDEVVTVNIAASDVDGDLNWDSFELVVGAAGWAIPSAGQITFTPPRNQHGVFEALYQVCDVAGACDTGLVTVSVEAQSDPPELTADAEGPIAGDETISIAVLANDTDPESDINPSSLSVVPVSSGGSWSAAGGNITFVPPADAFGKYSASYTVCDLTLMCSSTVVSIEYIFAAPIPAPNQPPIVQPIDDQHVAVGRFVSIPLAVTDPDGDPLAIDVSGLPPGFVFNSAQSVIAGLVPAPVDVTWSVLVTASDGESSVDETFELIVAPISASSLEGQLRINEVMYATTIDGEFVEILNIGGTPVSLENVTIGDDGLDRRAGSFEFRFPATDEDGQQSVLAPGEIAVLWLHQDGPSLGGGPQGLEYRLNAGSAVLATSDDLWLIDASGALADYMSWGNVSSIHIGTQPGPAFWDETDQLLLSTAADQSLSYAVTLADAASASCWEPNGSGDAAGRCEGAQTTLDSDVSTESSVGWPNTAN